MVRKNLKLAMLPTRKGIEGLTGNNMCFDKHKKFKTRSKHTGIKDPRLGNSAETRKIAQAAVQGIRTLTCPKLAAQPLNTLGICS